MCMKSGGLIVFAPKAYGNSDQSYCLVLHVKVNSLFTDRRLSLSSDGHRSFGGGLQRLVEHESRIILVRFNINQGAQ